MSMTRPLTSDPLRNFKFHVNIFADQIGIPLVRMGFMSVSGLAIQSEVIPYREGGNNTTTRKMPGQTDFGPIGLSRGMMAVGDGNTGTDQSMKWFKHLFSVVQGGGTGGPNDDFRVWANIDILQHPITRGPYAAGVSGNGPVKARFTIYNCWPMAIAWSDLDAGGNAVVIEQLTLAHEGFDVAFAGTGLGEFLN